MRVLVGCEFTGVVRDAFRALGHDAWSCDVLPSEGDPRWHYQADLRGVLLIGWDLLILHPPCTYLSNSGAKHLYRDGKKVNGIDPDRWQKMEDAAAFFRLCLEAPADKIIVENPVMHGHAKKLVLQSPAASDFRIHYVQPYEHGHGEQKKTALWTKGLPLLQPSDEVDGRNQSTWKMSPGPNRGQDRSRTFPGIAAALAQQYG